MRRWAREESDTTDFVRGDHSARADHQVSGVHAATTSPAPNLEELDAVGTLVGSIPLEGLCVDYQAVVDLVSGDTVGYAVQSSCPSQGMSNREDLIARAALEKKLGELGRAIRARAVHDCSGQVLYVPVHPGELREHLIVQPDDPIFIHDAPMRLELSHPTLPAVALAMLRELSSRSSMQLVIDDFGAGLATLKHWVELSPAAVKIDAELIAGIDQSRRKQAAVRAIVALGADLGAEVIAKGVDCDAEADAVMECGVRFAQGFALGAPTPLPAISMWPPRR